MDGENFLGIEMVDRFLLFFERIYYKRDIALRRDS